MRPTDQRPDRRAFLLLGAGAGAALLSGCTLNNPFRTASTPAAEAVAHLSPDAAAAVRAVVQIRTVQLDLEVALSAFPDLAKPLHGLDALHQAHVAALLPAVPKGVDAEPPDTAAPAPPPTNRAGTLRRVRASETELRTLLLALAGKAESGPFARLLGTMAAGLSQQLVELGR